MTQYTKEEKQLLLDCLNDWLTRSESNRRILTDELKDKWVQRIWKVEELRVKLILNIDPINKKNIQK